MSIKTGRGGGESFAIKDFPLRSSLHTRKQLSLVLYKSSKVMHKHFNGVSVISGILTHGRYR